MNGRSHAPIQDVSPLIYASTKHLFVHRNQSMLYMMLLYRENFATDVTHVRVMKPLFRMQEADMNDSKDATHALQFPEQEEKPTHACTQDTSTKYSHWYGRYHWLAFIVGSPFLFFAFAVVNCFVFYLFLIIAEGRTVETSPVLMQTVLWASQTIVFVPAIGAALLLCWMVNRSGRRRLWALAACGIIALLASCFSVSCTLPQTEPGTGKFMVCFAASPRFWESDFWHPSHAVAPLIIGVLFAFIGRDTPTDPNQNVADAESRRVAA